SRQRLQIYSNMYFWRLIDILGQEYPTVLHILGPRRFNRLALQFLEAHPSRSYSLNFLSVKFPEFVRREAKAVVHCGLCADVATVERTMEDVFDAAYVEPLSAKAWKKIPMGKWATGRLKMTPAMKLLELGYPVNNFIAAVREKKKASLPRRAKEWLVVYRKNWTVWRAPLSRIRFVLLSCLQAGRTLTQAFEACAALKGFDAEEFTEALGGWFRQWAADGLIVGVE
ncbi:MAG: DNA-binding domain-containing protein, partial [Planctomycetes bacterium]|nr:DNA-binding domain-containing protein [Planctomycetota bacterium]